MSKRQYATPEERWAAVSQKARAQMIAQHERARRESGKELGYFGAHRRVRQERGRAADQTCSCGKPARHWAHLHGTDPIDPFNYEAMCVPCHFRYDGVNKGPWDHEVKSRAAYKAWETKRRNARERELVELASS